ncbi:MAG: hypothetical protein HY308_15900 [Gammaproteobacteria bacterium]|nr:hypothetical protein [Gammaproteobacteria bacterium]
MRLPTLQQFFRHQLQQSFHDHGLNEAGTVDYVAEVLARFAYTHLLYSLKDTEGRPLEYIVDMLIASQEAKDRRRHGSIVRHIGDYTLFMSGLFRERVAARGELDYYVAHGRNAFWRSADYEANPARRHVYRRLYEEFSPISDVLDYLRRVQLPVKDRAGNDNLLAAYWRA